MKAQWIALAWLALVPAAVYAQAVEAGERIRVRTTDGARMVAMLVEVTPSDLGLRHDGGDVRIPLDRVQTLERSLGEQRRFAKNFLITTGVGALAIGAVAVAVDDGECSSLACFDGGETFLMGSALGALVSAPIGLIVGLTARSERWEPTTLTRPGDTSLTLMPVGAGRVTLGASVPVGPGR